MNIIEKIKSIFKRSKIKALPEPETNYSNERKQFLEEMHCETKPNRYENSYLESSLEQYFACCNEILEEEKGYISQKVPYRALVRINALDGDRVANKDKEQELLGSLYHSDNYTVQQQLEGNQIAFYHIQSKGYVMPEYKDMIRLYINCRHENIAEIAQNLLQFNQDPNFYLKIDSADAEAKRSERIVIYTSDNNVNYQLQLINYLKQIRPDLFVDSEKGNPFMQQIDGVRYARQPLSGNFYNINGSVKKVAVSTNTFIANIINESYVQTVREIASRDPNLSFLLTQECYYDENLYLRNYSYINAYYHDYLMSSMEQKMAYLSQMNNVPIVGIENKQQNQYRSQEESRGID